MKLAKLMKVTVPIHAHLMRIYMVTPRHFVTAAILAKKSAGWRFNEMNKSEIKDMKRLNRLCGRLIIGFFLLYGGLSYIGFRCCYDWLTSNNPPPSCECNISK